MKQQYKPGFQTLRNEVTELKKNYKENNHFRVKMKLRHSSIFREGKVWGVQAQRGQT